MKDIARGDGVIAHPLFVFALLVTAESEFNAGVDKGPGQCLVRNVLLGIARAFPLPSPTQFLPPFFPRQTLLDGERLTGGHDDQQAGKVKRDIDGKPARQQPGVDENILGVRFRQLGIERGPLALDDHLMAREVQREKPILTEEPAVGTTALGLDGNGKIERTKELAQRQEQAAVVQVADESVFKGELLEPQLEDQQVLVGAGHRRERFGRRIRAGPGVARRLGPTLTAYQDGDNQYGAATERDHGRSPHRPNARARRRRDRLARHPR